MSQPFSTLTPTPAATSSTTSSTTPPVKQPSPDKVTPGTLGFLAVFFVAIVTWLLLRNMTGRLRRMNLREKQRESDEQD